MSARDFQPPPGTLEVRSENETLHMTCPLETMPTGCLVVGIIVGLLLAGIGIGVVILLITVGLYLLSRFGNETLSISPDTVSYRLKYLGESERFLIGDIVFAGIERSVDGEEVSEKIVVRNGPKDDDDTDEITFGDALTPEEREWVYGILSMVAPEDVMGVVEIREGEDDVDADRDGPSDDADFENF